MPVDIRGKSYNTVAERIASFRNLCPARDGWGLLTEVMHRDERVVVVRASIVSPDGRTVAQGTAEEVRTASSINKTSALENAETSAWGRALAAFGLGGDEVATADELASALIAQKENARAIAEQRHHPSWEASKAGFFAALGDVCGEWKPPKGVKPYDALKALCADLGRPKPSAMDDTQRHKLLGWLASEPGWDRFTAKALELVEAA